MKAENKMEYLFYIEGLNREVWQVGASSKCARATLWASLTDDDKNAVVQIECIDERELQNRLDENSAPTYQPWHPMEKAVDKKHIGKLIEELGECAAASARCLIQGIEGKEPTTGKVNREWLEDEMADVLAQIKLSIKHFELDVNRITNRAEVKAEKCKTWHEMA